MRFLATIYGFLALIPLGMCQNAVPQSRTASSEEMIRHAIEFGAFEGNMQKTITRMGDAASVSVTRVLAERDPSASDIQIVLVILRSSFADPTEVEAASDREPRTTLFVLHSLDRFTKDLEIKKQIAETGKYVQQQFEKYKTEPKTTDSH
jgi:hypothetical protein